ncbi:MAG TPA: hypothetical protein VMB79_05280 [Jatrophihabitans sp.]|nr:hypothetical protein [Jatrophihabitans sp.]
MRLLPGALLLCLSLVVAGCASVSPSGSGAASGSPGGSADSPPGAGSPGPDPTGAGSPVPAPSDSDGLQLLGPVPLSLLSLTGPLQPAGVHLARTLPALLDRYRAAGTLACPPAGCWHDAQVPAGTVLLGVRPATVACYRVSSITTARQPEGLRLDLQLAYRCPPGRGSAARMPAMLIGLPAGADTGRVTVRASLGPGTPFDTLGTATLGT